MKAGLRILVLINLALTMIYVAGVDSLSNFNVVAYGALLAGLWWIVKAMNKRVNKTEE